MTANNPAMEPVQVAANGPSVKRSQRIPAALDVNEISAANDNCISMNEELLSPPPGPSRIATFWVQEPELNIVSLGPVRSRTPKPKFLKAKRRVSKGKLKSVSFKDDVDDSSYSDGSQLKAVLGTSLEKRHDRQDGDQPHPSGESDGSVTDSLAVAISRVAESNKATEWTDPLELPRISAPFPYRRMKTDFTLPLIFKSSSFQQEPNQNQKRTRVGDFTMPKRANTFLSGAIYTDFGRSTDLALDFSNVSPNNLPERPRKGDKCVVLIPKKNGLKTKKAAHATSNSSPDLLRIHDFPSRNSFPGVLSQTKILPARKIGIVRGEQNQSINFYSDGFQKDKEAHLASTIEALALKRERTMFPSSYGYHSRSHSPTFKRLVQVRKALVERMQNIPDHSPRPSEPLVKSQNFAGGRRSESSGSDLASTTTSLPLIHPPPSLEIKPKFVVEELHLFLPKVTQDSEDEDYHSNDGNNTSSSVSAMS